MASVTIHSRHKPHTHQLMVTLTILKTLTGIVSFSFSVTLISYIPMFLKVKIREFMLKKKTLELGRGVNIMRKQREDGKHVRMLTQQIRKSLDKDKILHTTLEELSKTMGLHNSETSLPPLRGNGSKDRHFKLNSRERHVY